MKYKWPVFWVIIAFYTLGMVGFAWQTYTTTQALQATQPTVTPGIETLKIVFIMLGGLGVVIPAYLNAYNSIETQKNTEHRLRFDTIENTYELLERWDAPALLEARRYTRELKTKHKDLSANQLIEQIDNDASLKQSLILVLNYFESVRVSIRHSRVDPTIIADSMYLIFDDIFDRFKPYITEKMASKIYSDLCDVKKSLEKHRNA